MPTNTIYAPVNVNSLDSTKLNRKDDATIGTAALNTTTPFDLKLDHDTLVLGAEVVVSNATLGDYLTFQVIDKDNVLGYGANFVAGEYVKKRGLAPIFYQSQIQCRFPAKPKAGLYLRTIYTSVGTVGNNPEVIINYDLNMVLV